MSVSSVRTPGVRRVRAGAVVLVLLVLVGQAFAVGVPERRAALTMACLVALDVVGAIFAVRAARRGDRAAWLLVATGELLVLATNTAMGRATASGYEAWFWTGSACGIAASVVFAAALLAFPSQRARGWQRAALAGEAVAVLGCGFMYLWYFDLQPLLNRPTDWSRWPLTVGFPLGDLLVLMGLSAVVLRGGLNAGSRPVALLTVGFSIALLADASFGAIGDDGNHSTGPLSATLTGMLASLCITLAAMWQSTAGDRSGESTPRRPWAPAWFSYLPYGAVGAALALMVTVTVHEGQIRTWGGLVLGLILVTAGVAARQIVSLHDSRQHGTIDPLTGLVNRVGLNRRLTQALRRGEPIALLLIDLDGFKAVNDTYGHNTGDLLLLEFAAALRANVRGSDIACRIGGDEFVILQYAVTGEADVTALARRILAASAGSPVRVGERSITARASIGAALATDGETGDELRHRADIAMYQAKRAGRHEVVIHRPGMLDRRADDAALGQDLEAAVRSGQLRVLYQPMIELATGRPVGAEALVRWHHPVRGVVAPLDFIPVAEQTGAITDVGLYVLEQACREARNWPGEPYVSVNLAARQLQDPALVPAVLAVLDRTGLVPGRLVLEITESAVVDDRVAIPAIEELRRHGVRFAIDDFGTGYSSLQYLSRLPADTLKIDRSFVAELDNDGKDSAITEAIVRLADILDLSTVAEGIETAEQEAELRRLGCHTGQGFLYARPLPPDDVRQFFAERRVTTFSSRG
ncbi:putative bifunctional diguanylate cyclase/phosphodiesterase [Paractinoplanes lichenicola]|uniref:Bifunctional diguanylate cyclase/phosphodiesterase n=1 Tax=Paractinoplanes lichenicola TaxID=2802976 RepID=A0ABS1VVD7_9ACTN|nr:bifunctional diguanylate cyclase/phosphodiesterase [Actinoplanes lichenicola]MBL7258440.1 bifunctional diguanylate cyclase/phosphodiesterase [Actinoplanes lichenicola]